MIKFENDYIIEAIHETILEHNNQLWDQKDEDKKISLYDEKNGIDIEELQKISNFRVALNATRMQPEEIEDFLSGLNELLNITNFSNFHLNIMNARDRENPANLDLSFLQKLNPHLINLQLRNIDLSSLDADSLKRFEDLRHLTLYKCNISNPELVETINDKCILDLSQNPIDKKYLPKMIQLLNKHDGKVDVSEDFKEIAEIIQKKEIELSRYIEFESQLDYADIEELKIVLDDDFNLENVDVNDVMEKVNGLENAVLVSTIERYSQLYEQTETALPAQIIIKNAYELSAIDLENLPNIRTVTMRDGENTLRQNKEPYTRDEYLSSRKRIDEIIQGIPKVGSSSEISEKAIFTQVYKRLASQIKYDDYAISKEGEKDEDLKITSRNLYGGLVEGQCVCAGYADILRNTLACVGIEAQYMGGGVDIDSGYSLNLSDPSGHAWNRVKLDGQWFNTDLTWDRDDIVANRVPSFFLKSDKDFEHERFSSMRKNEVNCDKSISESDIIKLFNGQDIDIASKEESESTKHDNIAYLGKAVRDAASRGLLASNIRKASNSISIGKINNVEEKNR